MANVLSSLAPTLFAASRRVPKELTGFLGVVNRNFNDQRVAQGKTVKVTVAPTQAVGSIPAPSMAFAIGSDRTPSTIDLTLNQTAQTTWNLTGEEERDLLNSGNAQELLRQTIEQGWRVLRNQIETYLGSIAILNASRSLGTSGTVPFGSDFNLIADLKKELNINGANTDGRALVMNSDAVANLSKLSALYKVNESGSDDLLRAGVLGRLQGFDLRESAGVGSFTKGTMTTALVNSGALAIGSTTVPYDGGTPGATGIKTGDVISFAGDTNKYVVKTGPGATATGNIVLQEPGLRTAVADNSAITVENSYVGHIALTGDAIAAVVRPIDQPESPDIEQMVISDPETKLSALLIRKVGDQVASWYMRVVYDAFAPNPYGIITLRG
jgi:hypothetical protein